VKISALTCVLICFLAAPESTKCQAFKGLQRTDIVIEDLGKVADDMGLTSESLRDQILVALKRDIPKIKIVTMTPGESYVYLQITSLQLPARGVAACVVVALRRYVEIIGDDGGKYFSFAAVWSREYMEVDSVDRIPSRIRDGINQAMTALAAEYYKQNP